MITPDDVVEVSRTGVDHPSLSLESLVCMTSARDWDGAGLYVLRFESASEIAAVINTNNHVKPPAPRRRKQAKIEIPAG